MTQSHKLVSAAFAIGLVLGCTLVWLAGSVRENTRARNDAETVYCAAPANQAALKKAKIALGPGTSQHRACSALVALSDPALETPASGINWQSIVLGSSVLAALITALLNTRAAKQAESRTRVNSLIDAIMTAYKHFDHEAQEYVDLMESLTRGRPSADNLRARHVDLHTALLAALGRIPGVEKQVEDVKETYNYLTAWEPGNGSARAARAVTAREMLDQLSSFIRGLENGRPRQTDSILQSSP